MQVCNGIVTALQTAGRAVSRAQAAVAEVFGGLQHLNMLNGGDNGVVKWAQGRVTDSSQTRSSRFI